MAVFGSSSSSICGSVLKIKLIYDAVENLGNDGDDDDDDDDDDESE